MAFIHGKGAFVSLNASNLSTFTTNTTFGRAGDSHDVTTYGKNAHVFKGGLKDGTATLQGVYDDGATGPQAIIEPLLGTNVTLIYRAEGTGAGKPEKSVNVLVTSYEETTPVANMITWQAECQMSDDVTETVQV